MLLCKETSKRANTHGLTVYARYCEYREQYWHIAHGEKLEIGPTSVFVLVFVSCSRFLSFESSNTIFRIHRARHQCIQYCRCLFKCRPILFPGECGVHALTDSRITAVNSHTVFPLRCDSRGSCWTPWLGPLIRLAEASRRPGRR